MVDFLGLRRLELPDVQPLAGLRHLLPVVVGGLRSPLAQFLHGRAARRGPNVWSQT
jgi:hypothetical protein